MELSNKGKRELIKRIRESTPSSIRFLVTKIEDEVAYTGFFTVYKEVVSRVGDEKLVRDFIEGYSPDSEISLHDISRFGSLKWFDENEAEGQPDNFTFVPYEEDHPE
ncbi:hypothetical protein FACS189444_1410 [Spirochaetia bacterium]|nr:hypothetical protein FACS189444_1410 [Spirochaetia bacterium]